MEVSVESLPSFPPLKPGGEDVSKTRFTRDDPEIEGGVARKAYFRNATHRKAVSFGPQVSAVPSHFSWFSNRDLHFD